MATPGEGRGRVGALRALLLRHVHGHSEGRSWRRDLRLAEGRIQEMGESLAARPEERVLDLDGYLALPGLINAHDHLGLDLMPALGHPPYRSFYRWAEEIYRPSQSPLREILAIPEPDRLRWGGWRNLVSGVTTVIHHDPYRARVFARRFPVRVPRVAWSHSLGFSRTLERDHARARGRPWVVHAAEGTDPRAEGEVDELEARGLLAPRTVLVHGIALTPTQENLLAERGAGLVWCPASNLRLYGATAPIDRLRRNVALALGTDSTLSGSATLLDELRAGLATGLASAADLLGLVTHEAADLVGLTRGEGRLQVGGVADLLLLADDGRAAADRLLAAEPGDLALVLVGGEPRLATSALADALGLGPVTGRVAGHPRWLAGDLEALRRRLLATAGEATVTAGPTWAILGG